MHRCIFETEWGIELKTVMGESWTRHYTTLCYTLPRQTGICRCTSLCTICHTWGISGQVWLHGAVQVCVHKGVEYTIYGIQHTVRRCTWTALSVPRRHRRLNSAVPTSAATTATTAAHLINGASRRPASSLGMSPAQVAGTPPPAAPAMQSTSAAPEQVVSR